MAGAESHADQQNQSTRSDLSKTQAATVVLPPSPKFPADFLALTLLGLDFSLGSIFGVFHDGEIHLAHFIINHLRQSFSLFANYGFHESK